MTTTKNEIVTQLKADLDRWNTELDELEETVRQMKAKVDQEYAEKVATLKQKRDEAEHKLHEFEVVADDTGKNLQSETKEMWGEIKHTLQESRDAFYEGLQDDEGNKS
jgi:uncharacterized coiled-coil DUF342 family protein